MLKIWGRPTSICTQRVLWACAEAGLEYNFQLASATMGAEGHISTGAEPFGSVDTDWYPTLFGTKKPRVLLLRKRLGELGLFAPPVSNLASFDSSMERQILAFQERHA